MANLNSMHQAGWSWVIWAFLAVLFSPQIFASESVTPTPSRVEQRVLEARARWRTATTNIEAGWHYARACFDWAEAAPTGQLRQARAEEGVQVCRDLLQRRMTNAAVLYYLALNEGQVARVKMFSALKLLHGMENAMMTSIQLDPLFDYAGAHRSLALMYRDAPGWPLSLGNKGKARMHIQKAVELAPTYPDNWIILLESYIKWDEWKSVEARLPEARRRIEAGKALFSGEDWEDDWKDWSPRWEAVLKEIEGRTAR